MPRLSVSLDPEQDEWLLKMKQEMGISKGKVIRECIEEVRTGDSLITGPVKSGETDDDNGLQEIERRLSSLEQTVEESIINSITNSVSEPQPSEDRRESSTQPPNHVADSDTDMSPKTHSSGSGPDTDSPPSDEGEPSPLPESVIGDLGVPETEDSPTQPLSESKPSIDSRSQRPTDTDAEVPSSESTSTSRGSPGDNAVPEDGPDGASRGDSPEMGDINDEDSGSSPADSDPEDAVLDAGQAAADEEIQKFDIDKSDDGAVRSHLESVLDRPDHATAVFACWNRLRDRGTVHTRSMQSFHEDYPLGYDDPREWWQDEIEPVLVKIPGVQPPEGGGKLYRFSY